MKYDEFFEEADEKKITIRFDNADSSVWPAPGSAYT